MLAALICVLGIQNRDSIELYRGAPIVGQAVRYWDVQDTVLDSALPDQNFGGEYSMSTGTGRVILIRFGGLDGILGPDRKIARAKLILSYASADKPLLNSVERVLQPWGEGPILTINSMKPALAAAEQGKAPQAQAPLGSATWKQSRAGQASWRQGGASASADASPIPGAKLIVLNDHEIEIDGLEAAIEEMAASPYDNHGFAIKIDSQMEIASSQSPEGKPRLELECTQKARTAGPDLSVVRIDRSPDSPVQGQDVTYTAHVKNVGDAPARGFVGRWIIRDNPGSSTEYGKPLEPGGEITATYTQTAKPNDSDHTHDPIAYRVECSGDSNRRNDVAEIQADGVTVNFNLAPEVAKTLRQAPEDFAQTAARTLNACLAQSRFSFAPEGALERINIGTVAVGGSAAGPGLTLELSEAGVTSKGADGYGPLRQVIGALVQELMGVPGSASVASRFPSADGWGDTECDGPIAAQLNLPYQAVFNPVFEGIRLEATGLLNASEVALVNRSLGGKFTPDLLTAMPKTTLLRTLDFNNGPLAADLEVYENAATMPPSGEPAFRDSSGAAGTILLKTKDAGTGQPNPFGALKDLKESLLIKATANGETAWARLPAWQLFDAASRGNTAAAVIDLHFNLPTVPVERETNLALNRIVSDSTNLLPAQLAALVDGDSQTVSKVGSKAGDWFEIDLGRDRPIAEVKLLFSGPFWHRFDLMVYSTGQKPDDAFAWSHEMDLNWSLEHVATDEGNGTHAIAYRGSALRFRFLRIVNREDAPAASLADVQVFAAKVTP